MRQKQYARAVLTAFLTPLFLGVAPVFGKMAINEGADPFTVAAWRTVISVLLLWILFAIFARRFIFIYPAGMLGCMVIGTVNGIGSLFYYSGLGRLDASLVQLLNGMYLIFAVLLSLLGGERLSWRVVLRITLATIALLILTGFGDSPVDWLGVGLMLGSALMFAGTVILSQYVLYEMPAPTVTLYTLTTMAVVVTMVWLGVGTPHLPEQLDLMGAILPPIFALGISTALSRLALFAGVKFLGGLETAVLALTEIGVALVLSFAILGDRLNQMQVFGVALMFVSILLTRPRDMLPRGINPNMLLYNMTNLQYQWIAFHKAFGTEPQDPAEAALADLSPEELEQIRRMMGAEEGIISPYTVNNKQPGQD
ncbi:MAG: DMT family transporter [Anaerolineaceae bacterium]|nr:DMT family transporter [Anaerolineaceae bacterium]